MSREERTYTSNLVAFARALRDRGVSVSTDDVVSAARALRAIDPLDRDQFYYGLKTTIVDDPTQDEVFDELFAEYWDELSDEVFREESEGGVGVAEVDERVAESGAPEEDDAGTVEADPPETLDADEGGADSLDDPSERTDRRGDTRGGDRSDDDADAAFEIGQQERSTTPTLVVDDRGLTSQELSLLVGELGRQLGSLRGFRRRVQPSGDVDLRRSLDVARERNPDDLPRIEKERSQAKVRFFVDVSHSMLRTMDQQFLLLFLFECMRQYADVRIFLFDVDSKEVTRHFQSANVSRTVEEMRQTQTEWGAGTTIGACLAEILAADPFVVDRDAVAVVVSDGWDAGDVELLRAGMSELERRCRSVVWLNPRAASTNYEPKVSGMAAALPYVNHFFGFADVDDLRDVVAHLRSQAVRGQ